MKTTFHYFLTASICMVSFLSCSKDKVPEENTDAQVTVQANDVEQVSSELDAIALEASTILEINPLLSGDNSVLDQPICGAALHFSEQTDPLKVTITFDGTNCDGIRKRSGVAVVSIAQGTKWKNAGAAVNIEFQDLVITRIKDNKSITLNGVQTYTNVSGGLLAQLGSLESVVHRMTGSELSVEFDNSPALTWQVAREQVFTHDNGIVVHVTGTHTEGSREGIAQWGVNRFGNSFVTSIEEPLVFRESCDYRLGGGSVTHTTSLFTATATFGLDASGNAADCPGSGKYYYRIEGEGAGGKDFSLLVAY